MTLVTAASLVLGVLLSSVSGFICYMGTWQAINDLLWLPGSGLVLDHPVAMLVVGVSLLTVGIASQPGLRAR